MGCHARALTEGCACDDVVDVQRQVQRAAHVASDFGATEHRVHTLVDGIAVFIHGVLRVGRVGQIEGQVVPGITRVGVDLNPALVLGGVNLGATRFLRAGNDAEFTGEEALDHDRQVRNVEQYEGIVVDVAQFGVSVVRIGQQGNRFGRAYLAEGVGTGTDVEVLVEFLVRHGGQVFRRDVGGVGLKRADTEDGVAIDLVEGYGDGEVVDLLDVRNLVGDETQMGWHGPTLDEVPDEHDVVGVNLLAVRPVEVIPQAEGVGQAVVGKLPAGCQGIGARAVDDTGRGGVDAKEVREDKRLNVGCDCLVGEQRVEGGRVGAGVAADDDAALLGHGRQ